MKKKIIRLSLFLGLIMVGTSYLMYKKITTKKRAKYAEQILALTNELAMN